MSEVRWITALPSLLVHLVYEDGYTVCGHRLPLADVDEGGVLCSRCVKIAVTQLLDVPAPMTARTGRRESTCTYCGKKIPTGTTVCGHHRDLANLEPEALAICTVSEDCAAAADGHLPECPVEQALQQEFGF